MTKRKKLAFRAAAFAILTIVLYAYVWPVVSKVNADLKAYSTRQAISNDYTLHTTPLPQSVVDDLCLKFGIEASSEHCQPGAIVYGPDFYDEIKSYFRNLPREDRTYEVVQDKLGAYLLHCEKPHQDGGYRCTYDLRGDKVYRIGIYFDENDFYWQVQASTGGS